jgi:allophanate hydrolase subunit 2
VSLRLDSCFGQALLLGPPTVSRLKFGVPRGGAFDRESFEMACLLAGTDRAWEIAAGVAVFVADAPGTVAVAGSPASARAVHAGEEVRVEVPKGLARVYVAFGQHAPAAGIKLADPCESNFTETLRVLPARFWRDDLQEARTVSPSSSRAGVRLVGGAALVIGELRSEPACVGAIQSTPDGTLIVIGPDGPTIGGYPKVAVVCEADLDKVGQLAAGGTTRLRPISLAEARHLRRRQAERRAEVALGLRELGRIE